MRVCFRLRSTPPFIAGTFVDFLAKAGNHFLGAAKLFTASQVYTFTARNARANASRSHLHRHAFNKWRLWKDVDADVGAR